MKSGPIGQVAPYKPLRKCGMEELAARQGGLQTKGGVAFARHADEPGKVAARQLVIDLFAFERWPYRLRMLTMPGLEWRFERKLLAERELGWTRRKGPVRTLFTGFENDRALYYASVTLMPGMPGLELKRIKPYGFAEMGVKTPFASHFFANVDEAMKHDWPETASWDAVWLDYTGPLSTERLAIIRRFFDRHITSMLIVTALRARFNKATVQAISRAGGHSEWVRKHIHGEVLHDIEYFDTVPMAQLAFRR